jgi:hypothetical protein
VAEHLLIGGAGSVVVVSDYLLEARDVIDRCARVTAGAAARVQHIARASSIAPASHDATYRAAAVSSQEADALERLSAALRTATDGYGWAEHAAAGALERAIAPAAALVAYLSGRLGILLLPSFVVAAGTAAATWMLVPQPVRDRLVHSAGESLTRLGHEALDDPRTTALVRLLTTAIDDAALGALGVPPALVATASALSPDSVARTAGAALALTAIAGVRGRDPVTISPGARAVAVAPPAGVAERVARIPRPERPVVIERYAGVGGSDRFEVYVGGTATLNSDGSPVVHGGHNPWDMASNLALVAEHESSSFQAVQLAMADAGVTTHTPVVFTGFSQGAAIATLLAESGDYATAGLVTIGAPTGGIPVTGAYPAIIIGHDDDPVTAVGGPQRVTNAVVVTATRGHEPWAPGDPVVAGHSFSGYVETASRVDDSRVSLVRDTIERLPAAEGGLGTSRWYTARRSPRT